MESKKLNCGISHVSEACYFIQQVQEFLDDQKARGETQEPIEAVEITQNIFITQNIHSTEK